MWHSSEVFFSASTQRCDVFSDWQGTGRPRGLFWYFRVSCLKSLVQVYSVPYGQEVLRRAYKHVRVILFSDWTLKPNGFWKRASAPPGWSTASYPVWHEETKTGRSPTSSWFYDRRLHVCRNVVTERSVRSILLAKVEFLILVCQTRSRLQRAVFRRCK